MIPEPFEISMLDALTALTVFAGFIVDHCYAGLFRCQLKPCSYVEDNMRPLDPHTAPLPDWRALPRAGDAPRIRVEPDTRDTINDRLYSDMRATGAKTVTSAMLAAHPTNGAEPFMPTTSKMDPNLYIEASYFPDSTKALSPWGRQERARLPSTNNPFTNTLDTDVNPSAIIREVRRSVVEDNRFRSYDIESRILERVFTHQQLSAAETRAIVERPQSNATTTGRSW